MHIIGGAYYHADMIPPSPESQQSTKFHTKAMSYIHPGNPGCYSSNMTGIPDYVLAFTNLGRAFFDEYVRDMLLIMMYYDFVSHLALTYARNFVVGFILLQARTTVVTQLQGCLLKYLLLEKLSQRVRQRAA